jgi:serine/threonine protein kinase
MSQKKYCINCFCILNAEVTICSRCKYTQVLEESPLYLKPPVRLMDQYYVGRVLGHGGFAITYLAYDRNLGMLVAIKEYFPIEFATRDSEDLSVVPFIGKAAELFQAGKDKFLKEARLLANFRSPNIVKIRQYFTAYNTAYFVMEYLTGQTLNQYIKEQGGKLPFARVREILMLLLDALDEVHENAIFHRDIKPDNIYLTAKGDPILLDFGAARQSLSSQTTHLLSFLTPGFAAAEQYSTNGVQGPWTDIYSLAATVYYALTGVLPPVPSDRLLGDAELIAPSKLGSDILPRDEEWLLKALSLQWSQRPGNIKAWRAMIEEPLNNIHFDIDTQIRNAEENFTKIAILPKLTHQILTPQDEQLIYDSAAFMAISAERVKALIEKALFDTGSKRGHTPWWEAEEAKKEAEQKRLEEEAKLESERLIAEQETQKQAEEIAKREEELQRKEAELRQKEAHLRREEELQRREEELRQKEAELLRKAQTPENATAPNQIPSPSPSPSPPPNAAQRSLSNQDLEDLADLSDELEDLVKLFETPSSAPTKAPQASPRATLDAHYAKLATKLSDIPVSKTRLIVPGPLPSRISNGLGMDFVLISPPPPDSAKAFSVGPPEWGFQPLAQRAFYLQATPVTQRHWQMLMYNNPSQFNEDPLLPVEQVSWDDCQLFVIRMNQFQEAHYRLPTEVEWEYGCSGRNQQKYLFCESESELGHHGWYAENAQQHTHPVGMKRANPNGLFDVLGNVWEWTQDPFIPLTEPQAPGPTNRKRLPQRTARGGGWNTSAATFQARARTGEVPHQRKPDLGFRLVIEIV